MKNVLSTLFFQTLLVSSLPYGAVAESSVPCQSAVTTLEKTEATASTWDNMRNKKGSLRFETDRLLKQGLSNLSSETKVVVESKPKKFLASSSDATYCKKKIKETKSSPLIYTGKIFSSQDDLSSWISDFSQGNGDEGKDLYKKCDRSCSPQYSYEIKETKSKKLNLKASVICGLPRDKGDNMYSLSVSCGPL